MFVIPTPYRQYTVMFLPLLGIVAGHFLLRTVDEICLAREQGELFRSPRLLWLIPLAVTLWHFLGLAAAHLPRPPLYLTSWIMILVVAGVLLRIRASSWALIALLAGLTVYPILQLPRGRSNENALEGIRHVMENSTPGETVMDGFTGWGLFRPHAYFYYAIHSELRQMLTWDDRVRLLADLQAGRIAPRLVLFDLDLRRISDPITAFFETNYEPTEREPVWKRKDVWLDEATGAEVMRLDFGQPPADLLVGPGWRETEMEDEIVFRRSRGRRSWLRVPIRTPGNFRVTIRARLEYLARPVKLELAVNGKIAGTLELASGWKDYVFFVPHDFVESGVNSFLLTYSATPRSIEPETRGPNTVIAVDFVQFERSSR
jgi:hypothetical protein